MAGGWLVGWGGGVQSRKEEMERLRTDAEERSEAQEQHQVRTLY